MTEAPYELPRDVSLRMGSEAQAPALLAALAGALNACDKAGILAKLSHGAVITQFGYVLPFGDDDPALGLGSRWVARTRTLTEFPADQGSAVAREVPCTPGTGSSSTACTGT